MATLVLDQFTHEKAGDRQIVESRMSKYNERPLTPRVGDIIRTPDGIKRVGHVYSDGQIQLCTYGSFYLGDCGISMSGSLDESYSLDRFVPTHTSDSAEIWIFSGDRAMADNGIRYMVDFRVYDLRYQ